jgi:hypothetical protein
MPPDPGKDTGRRREEGEKINDRKRNTGIR